MLQWDEKHQKRCYHMLFVQLHNLALNFLSYMLFLFLKIMSVHLWNLLSNSTCFQCIHLLKFVLLLYVHICQVPFVQLMIFSDTMLFAMCAAVDIWNFQRSVSKIWF